MGNLRIKTIVALCAIVLLCYVSLFAPEVYFWASAGICLPVFVVCALLNQKEDGIEQPFDKIARLFVGLAATLFCCLIATLLTFIIIAAICSYVMPDTTLYLFIADATFFAIGLLMEFIHMEIEYRKDLDNKDRKKL